MPRPERKIEMQHSFVSSFLIVEENQKSEPSPLSRKGSDFYYSVRITGLERLYVEFSVKAACENTESALYFRKL